VATAGRREVGDGVADDAVGTDQDGTLQHPQRARDRDTRETTISNRSARGRARERARDLQTAPTPPAGTTLQLRRRSGTSAPTAGLTKTRRTSPVPNPIFIQTVGEHSTRQRQPRAELTDLLHFDARFIHAARGPRSERRPFFLRTAIGVTYGAECLEKFPMPGLEKNSW